MDPDRETIETTQRSLIRVKTLAELIDTPALTIRDWVSNGKIPYIKLPTGGIRFDVSVVRKWYQRGAVEPIANRMLKI